jgi:hypothetical protein
VIDAHHAAVAGSVEQRRAFRPRGGCCSDGASAALDQIEGQPARRIQARVIARSKLWTPSAIAGVKVLAGLSEPRSRGAGCR